jgi:hypothetical protein
MYVFKSINTDQGKTTVKCYVRAADLMLTFVTGDPAL